MGLIQIVQDPNKFKWAGTRLIDRYSKSDKPNSEVLKAVRKYDNLLDIKFYLPTMKWHLLRFYNGFLNGKFQRVWELKDDEHGMRKEPGMWMVDMLKRCDTAGDTPEDVIKSIMEHEAELKAKDEKELSEQTKDAAKELVKPLKHLYDFGKESDYKGVF